MRLDCHFKSYLLLVVLCFSLGSCGVLEPLFKGLPDTITIPIPTEIKVKNDDLYGQLIGTTSNLNIKAKTEELATKYEIPIGGQILVLEEGTVIALTLKADVSDSRLNENQWIITPAIEAFDLSFSKPVVIQIGGIGVAINQISESGQDLANGSLDVSVRFDIGKTLGLLLINHVLKLDGTLDNRPFSRVYLPKINVEELTLNTKPNSTLTVNRSKLKLGTSSQLKLMGYVIDRARRTTGRIDAALNFGANTQLYADDLKVLAQSARLEAKGSFKKDITGFSFSFNARSGSPLPKLQLGDANIELAKASNKFKAKVTGIEVKYSEFSYEKKVTRPETYKLKAAVRTKIQSLQAKDRGRYNLVSNNPFLFQCNIEVDTENEETSNFKVKSNTNNLLPIETLEVNVLDKSKIVMKGISLGIKPFSISGWKELELSLRGISLNPAFLSVELLTGEKMKLEFPKGVMTKISNTGSFKLIPTGNRNSFDFNELTIRNRVEELLLKEGNDRILARLKDIDAGIIIKKQANNSYHLNSVVGLEAYGGKINGLHIKKLGDIAQLKIPQLNISYTNRLFIEIPFLQLVVKKDELLREINNVIPQEIPIPSNEDFKIINGTLSELIFKNNTLETRVSGRVKGRLPVIGDINLDLKIRATGNIDFDAKDNLSELEIKYSKGRITDLDIDFNNRFFNFIDKITKISRKGANAVNNAIDSEEYQILDELKDVDDDILNELKKIKVSNINLNTNKNELTLRMSGNYEG